ncbi:MAG: hypothetical protein RLZZ592_85 [Pseudomonadota bacterium]|jgi:hypothetical protein|nr:hypothetical protein [Pseudomonadota bacterium]
MNTPSFFLPLTLLRTVPPPKRGVASVARFGLLRSWLRSIRQRRTRLVADLDRDRAAHEACASEGVTLEVRTIDLDGRPFEALYRHGELVCLLPDRARH